MAVNVAVVAGDLLKLTKSKKRVCFEPSLHGMDDGCIV